MKLLASRSHDTDASSRTSITSDDATAPFLGGFHVGELRDEETQTDELFDLADGNNPNLHEVEPETTHADEVVISTLGAPVDAATIPQPHVEESVEGGSQTDEPVVAGESELSTAPADRALSETGDDTTEPAGTHPVADSIEETEPYAESKNVAPAASGSPTEPATSEESASATATSTVTSEVKGRITQWGAWSAAPTKEVFVPGTVEIKN